MLDRSSPHLRGGLGTNTALAMPLASTRPTLPEAEAYSGLRELWFLLPRVARPSSPLCAHIGLSTGGPFLSRVRGGTGTELGAAPARADRSRALQESFSEHLGFTGGIVQG